MKDFTKGPIAIHILAMAFPLAISMLVHIAYQSIDLYFVSRIGEAATAGFSAANNVGFMVAALTQTIGVGTVALIAHAVGRKDQADANLIFNQAIALSVLGGAATVAIVSISIYPYMRSVSTDLATIDAGATFIFFALPGCAFSTPLAVLTSALRGTGVVRPTVLLYTLTVILNAILAPILVAGWGTGVPLGVRGAGLATSISIILGTILLAAYFRSSQRYMSIDRRLMLPRITQWRRILSIGLPVGAEFTLMFLLAAVVYYAIRDFGASAQAGYGIGSRIVQAILLPAMAIAYAAAPIVGQNFGASNNDRVQEAFRKACLIGFTVMLASTALVHWKSRTFVAMFYADQLTSTVATDYLRLVSLAFVAQGLVYTCSGVLQGLGNTIPSLISTSTCFLLFTGSMTWLSMQAGFNIEHVWHLLMASITLQALMSLGMVHSEFRRRLLLTI